MSKRHYITEYPRKPMGVVAILLLALAINLCSCGADRNFNRGKKNMELGEYYAATEEFKQAYRKTAVSDRAKRGQIQKLMADCYAKINYASRAVASYRGAIRYGATDIDDRMSLARQLMKTGSYKEAAKEFQQVLDSLPDNDAALQGLQAATKADSAKRIPSKYTVKRANVFNSTRSDYSPAFYGDNNDRLYFTSTRNEAEGDETSGITGVKAGDIFVSEKDDRGNWSKPEKVQGGLNSEYDEGAANFSPDGATMWLTQCATDPSYPRYATIMTSARSDAQWKSPTKVELTRDTLSSYAHPAISPDGLWLYFVSDMPGGLGGLDIWRARITATGLGGVENLGEPINTEGDEMFPTFRPNGDLYFSSNGHQGLGGLDLFIATVDKQGHYVLSHPGYPLNSSADDFGMTFEGLHNRGFFASNRNDARGWDHIYSFESDEIIQTVKGWVYEADGYELPAAQVYMIGSDGTNERKSVKGDGSFTVEVKPGVDYLFLATCKGFLNHKEEISIAPSTSSEEQVMQFPLASISAPVLIDNIFFDFDKATLRPESEEALTRLVNTLNENPNVTIELSAHTDYKGSADYNRRLSQRRAEAVTSYLKQHGIAADRLTAVGYGEDKPKTIRRKQAESITWLKEGDVLDEQFIATLTPDQQEVCCQLNRRTEFRVLRTTYGMFDEHGKLRLPAKKKPSSYNNADSYDIYIE